MTSLSPPSHGPPKGMGEENRGEKRVKGRTRARYYHFRCYIISGRGALPVVSSLRVREKRRKPARFYDYDVTSGL